MYVEHLFNITAFNENEKRGDQPVDDGGNPTDE